MKLQIIGKMFLYLGLLVVSFILAIKFLFGINTMIQIIASILLFVILVFIRFRLIQVGNLAKRLGYYYVIVIVLAVAYTPFLVKVDILENHPLLKEAEFFEYDVGLYSLEDQDNELRNMKINEEKNEIIFLKSNTEIVMFDKIEEKYYSFDFNSDFPDFYSFEEILSFHFFEGNILVSIEDGRFSELVLIDIRNKEVITKTNISYLVVDLIGNNIYLNSDISGYIFRLNSDLTRTYKKALPDIITYAAEIETGYIITVDYGDHFTSLYYDASMESIHDLPMQIQTSTKEHYVYVTNNGLITINHSSPESFELEVIRIVSNNQLIKYFIYFPLDYSGNNNIMIETNYSIQIDRDYIFVKVGWPLNKDLVYKINYAEGFEENEFLYFNNYDEDVELYEELFLYDYNEGEVTYRGFIIIDSNIYYLSPNGLHYLDYYNEIYTFSHIFSISTFVIALISLPLFTLGKAIKRDKRTKLKYRRSNYDTYKSVNKNKEKQREKW